MARCENGEDQYDDVVSSGLRVRSGGAVVRRSTRRPEERRPELMLRFGDLIAKSARHLRTSADDHATLLGPARKKARRAAEAAEIASAKAAMVQRERDEARRVVAAMEKTIDISEGSSVRLVVMRRVFEYLTGLKLIDEEVEYHGCPSD